MSGPADAPAVDSFFADAGWGGSTRVCRGTSCHLRGGAALVAAPTDAATVRAVHCLGYCDRSPAVLLPDGRVAVGAAAARGEPGRDDGALPDVRCRVAEPVVLARLRDGDHSELARAEAAGVWQTLRAALGDTPEAVASEVERAGERGRGGSGYSTGAKWRACAAQPGSDKWAVANGDEGDPGSFVDRVLMQHDPHAVLEGLALCGYAIGASRGLVYVRGEYPVAAASLERAIAQAREAGWLGPSVASSGFAFDVDVVHGRGSYVCGEETALLNAVEGQRGEVRLRPPYPVERGLHGAPTVVNNVETLVNVPAILARGARAYRRLGTEGSPGTKALCLNAGFARPGIVEAPFGESLGHVIEDGGGTVDGAALEAVLLGGPMGSIVFDEAWDVPIDYEAMGARGIQLGHGGMVALPADTDWRALLLHWLDFARRESCGRCVPCRLGSQRAHALVRDGGDPRERLASVFDAMERGSLCAFGRLAPGPVRALIARHGSRIFAS
ncbi:MAG TPA: NADH-ubiquinone oxidoreductase-F iron-sulfur binding region domain-containing protein [Myxococcota bacterium]|nr:NADH-ubiquinone oxidoreductase-F iron-sulfur binding region domain-containing protein [Myxococcota bacterium]